MALEKHTYRMFENIVGSENISDDAAILETYTFNWLNEFDPSCAPGKFLPHSPEAVVLPGSTEEVQSVVRACNRYGVKYKALSTGYGAHSLPGQPGVIVLDLRRMNRILEIDEKNKYAVVEPYVTWAQLEAEVIKRGLFTTPVQAGSQASVLANLTSGWGMNTFGNHGGHNGRNALGIEWVLPTGDVLKLGPAGTWFTGDGPGPSLRGIMRGHVGAQGGMGVFTKGAIKLHHWPGPPKLETVTGGMMSSYLLKEVPEYLEMLIPSFQTYEEMVNFMYQVGDAEIAYSMIRVGSIEHMTSLMGSVSNKDLYEQWYESGLVKVLAEEVKHPCVVMIFANSRREFEYRKKVLDEIIKETGGEVLEAFRDGPMRDLMLKEMPVAMIGNCTLFIHHCGGFVISSGYMGTTESVWRHMGIPQEELKGKYMATGKILDDGLDSTYHNSFENNSYVYVEMEFHYDAANPDSVDCARQVIAGERNARREEKSGFEPNDIGLTCGDFDKSLQQRIYDMGPHYGNFHVWQEKIKRAFDPRDVSDRSNYGAGLILKDVDLEKEVREK